MPINDLKRYEIWLVTGSQHLYGEATLKLVAEHSSAIVAAFNTIAAIPVRVALKPVVTRSAEVTSLCMQANNAPECIGLITWCHTFSPSKMWINGLRLLDKPLLHLHTQFNRDIPWNEIDMDFMNLNQSAHGDREHGYIMTRMRLARKVVVGHWQESDVHERIGIWARAAAGWHEFRHMKIARFGDNMRDVAVTEGDKVEAQIALGLSVDGFGVGDLAREIDSIAESDVDMLASTFDSLYEADKSCRAGSPGYDHVRAQARIELGMRRFLERGGYHAFTTTFEDLHGLAQLPGLAVQRLMADGYGFGAEGDWKHAAMVRALKVMGAGMAGGCSFMEDYTYHLDPSGMKVLGAHMLEVCPSLAAATPRVEVHPLGIGGKEDPARLVFTVGAGPALNASLIDMGDRFRVVVNTVDCVAPDLPLPKLPVARALWMPHPNLKTGAACWIYAGGAHHTAFSQSVSAECMDDFCEMAGVEYVEIGRNSRVKELKKELRMNELYYMLAKGR